MLADLLQPTYGCLNVTPSGSSSFKDNTSEVNSDRSSYGVVILMLYFDMLDGPSKL